MSIKDKIGVEYYRTAVALRMERKPLLDERLAALGLNTIGDLTSMLISSDESIIAVLKPYAETHMASKGKTNTGVSKKKLLDELKELSPAELAEIVAKYRKTETSEQA
jgi:hypothetical protein